MAIKLKRPAEIEALREANRLVAETFREIEPAIQPGVLLSELDRLATEFLTSRGAEPLYLGYRGSPGNQPPFPGTICASVNHEICHGLPDNRRLNEGDIVGIDIGVRLNGWCGDACITYAVGEITPRANKIMVVANECMRHVI